MIKSVGIENPDGTPYNTRIFNAETGDEIHGVQHVRIEIKCDELYAEVKLICPQIDLRSDAKFVMSHPKTGELTAIKRIEFEDGEAVEF